MKHACAGQPAEPGDLISVAEVTAAYFDCLPNPDDPTQAVAFGTSGHRGSSLNGSFTESHIVAITAAVVEYRKSQFITGPILLGRDTHALSEPAWHTAIEVLGAAGVPIIVDGSSRFTPTPVISHGIIRHNRGRSSDLADGIVVTPSHNPPQDGGFKYNPPHGGPADAAATGWIQKRANEILGTGIARIPRLPLAEVSLHRENFLDHYLADLPSVLNLAAIRAAGLRIGADPMGGASVDYWQQISERLQLGITVVNSRVDPTWSFMTLDWDGAIRMDCSSADAMAGLIAQREHFDLATGNDADADRHGIVTKSGLMAPNHYLAVAIDYLFRNRPNWPKGAGIGKTLVSSSIIDRIASDLARPLFEVPVGFKWFVAGLTDASLGFGGEESAGASFLTTAGQPWSTDKDGLLLALLAAEIHAVTGTSASERFQQLTAKYGSSSYARIDAPATRQQKLALSKLTADQVPGTELAGEKITAKLTHAPGNGAAIGGLKVCTESAWFAARPSGTEDVYKIYAESFRGPDHLAQVQHAAAELVTAALGPAEG